MDHDEAIQSLATERYLLSEMNPAERDSFEEHYFDCPICAQDVRVASQFLQDAKEVWAGERPAAPVTKPEPEKQSSWNWLSWLQPQFAAPAIATLLVVAGIGTIGSLNLRRQLADATSPRIVTATTLRPETRGEPVTLAAGSPIVVQFDLPDTAAPGVHYSIQSAAGDAVFHMNGGPERAGERVTLSIPRLEIPAGRYALIVTNTASGNRETEIARFPLNVTQP
ncbi:MAG: hypothetical protein ABI995_10600 [Acidobacteriota bacterium]